MNWPAEFDGAHSSAYMDGYAVPKDAAWHAREAIAKRIEAIAAEQTSFDKERVALECAAIVRGEK